MKISIDIDATPEEARQFFGLPNIAPLQDALVAEMTERMRASLNAMDPEALWRQWMPAAGAGAASGAGVDVMRQFWDQAMRTAMGSGGSDEKSG